MEKHIDRQAVAENVLRSLGIPNFHYLGMGGQGVAFHDNHFVYKVLVAHSDRSRDAQEHRCRLYKFLKIVQAKTLYRIEAVLEHDGFVIQKYKYEESTPCVAYALEESIPFLVECWQNKIIVKDCKPENFIRVDSCIKLIDLDCTPYSDNLFLNMCARMFLCAKYANNLKSAELTKLLRTAINNFNIPELDGLQTFVNKVFSEIIYCESKISIERYSIALTSSFDEVIPFTHDINLENIRFKMLRKGKRLVGLNLDKPKLSAENYFAPDNLCLTFSVLHKSKESVSLLIKTCAQDCDTVEQNIKHIIWQLSSPERFCEIVVLVDSKTSCFLRQYNDNPSLEKHIAAIQKLQSENIIDNYIVFDESLSPEVNKRWFGKDSSFSHSASNVPISSQLYAFEQCRGNYILQCDSDVMIGRKDYTHPYLKDMIAQLKLNRNVISVGFNICNKESKAYYGFENGGFVPEVRMCLFDKARLLDSRPWPNTVDSDGRLKLSWYRSLEKAQKSTGRCSIRGGDERTFYVHPQNYRKNRPYAWMGILDRIEQGYIPELQYGKYDCEGSFRAWCTPLRTEKMVIVSCFKNVSYDRFLRMWCSVTSQTFDDFGIILVDDCSDNGLQYFIDSIIKPYKEHVTFLIERISCGKMECEYRAIHYYVANPDAVVVMVDGDDALIGNTVLADIWRSYVDAKADVTIGRVHQTYRLQPYYRYPVDFVNPRQKGGNVWQHLKTFRKYLFESIPLHYLKWNSHTKAIYKREWYDRADDYAIMVPIVEMSENPIQKERINYYYERDTERIGSILERSEKCIGDILSKPRLTPACKSRDGKRFMPNENRVEIDITYECNLKCSGCNRSCAQAPTNECMSIADIKGFIKQSISIEKKWSFINIMGGEPTLHKDFLEIVRIIQTEYVDRFSPDTKIQITSNGYSQSSLELCAISSKWRSVVIDNFSKKASANVEYFTPFNDAPIDDHAFKHSDYSRGCWVTSYCGLGLNRRGWYACSICGAIDRALGQNHAIDSLKDISPERLKLQLRFFCRFCGNYKHYAENGGNFVPRCEKAPYREIISTTWRHIYDEINRKGE